jgi:osmoprotectant transport system substrate-binding protein
MPPAGRQQDCHFTPTRSDGDTSTAAERGFARFALSYFGICQEEPIVRLSRLRRAAVAAVLVPGLIAGLIAGFLGGCSGAGPGDPTQRPIRIASYDFVENQILAELYGQAMRRADLPVRIEAGLGTREIVEPALEQGQVDFVVDYLGTALDFLVPGTKQNHGSPQSVHQALAQQFSTRGIAVLGFAPATDQNGFAVRRTFARHRNVSRLSDLVPMARLLVLGGPPECPRRRYCLVGLKQVYGLEFGEFRAMATRAATAAALTLGEIDVGMLETTDPRLAGGQLVLLQDDRRLQPVENIVPVVRQETLRVHDDLADAIAPVTAALTTQELIKLNHAVEVQHQLPAAAAAAWLDRHGVRS